MIKIILTATLIAATPFADTGAKQKECETACDVHYTKVYKDCNGLVECQTYVRHQHRSCYNECAQEKKDEE